MGLFDEVRGIPECRVNEKAEILRAYEENHARLLKQFGPQISEIEKILKSIREERSSFYSKTLPNIKEKMRDDEASEDCIEEWISKIRDNMENSFSMSEKIVKDFWIETKEEFSQRLASEMKGL